MSTSRMKGAADHTLERRDPCANASKNKRSDDG
jgi:hypothetical protein